MGRIIELKRVELNEARTGGGAGAGFEIHLHVDVNDGMTTAFNKATTHQAIFKIK